MDRQQELEQNDKENADDRNTLLILSTAVLIFKKWTSQLFSHTTFMWTMAT